MVNCISCFFYIYQAKLLEEQSSPAISKVNAKSNQITKDFN